MSGKELFVSELKDLGYQPEDLGGNRVAFDYTISEGKFAERVIKVGFEVPPDFSVTCPTGPHIRPALIPMNTGGIGNDRAAESPLGSDWQYLSRPYPGNGWSRTNRKLRVYMWYIKHLLDNL